MKKSYLFLFCLILIGCSLFANASERWRGFYLGVLIGASWIDYQNYPFPPTEIPTHINDTGIAPMYTFGFGLNQFVALEIGAIYPKKIRFLHLHFGPTSARFKNNVAYVAAKFSYLLRKYRLFFKVGVGYVVRDTVIDQEVKIVNGAAVTRPVYGAGLDVRFKPHWELEFAWMQAAKSTSNLLPATNFFGIGVHYLFL